MTFKYNPGLNCIEEEGKFLAYLNPNNVHCIISRLNELADDKIILLGENTKLKRERDEINLYATACDDKITDHETEILKLKNKIIALEKQLTDYETQYSHGRFEVGDWSEHISSVYTDAKRFCNGECIVDTQEDNTLSCKQAVILLNSLISLQKKEERVEQE